MIFPTLASQQDFEIVQRSETDKLEGSAYISVGLEHIVRLHIKSFFQNRIILTNIPPPQDDIISDLSKALAKI